MPKWCTCAELKEKSPSGEKMFKVGFSDKSHRIMTSAEFIALVENREANALRDGEEDKTKEVVHEWMVERNYHADAQPRTDATPPSADIFGAVEKD